MGKLLKVGGRLAVLGVDPDRPMGSWHVMRPGTWSVPAIGDGGKTYGRAHCGLLAVTNGYAADFVPPAGQMCPACAGQM